MSVGDKVWAIFIVVCVDQAPVSSGRTKVEPAHPACGPLERTGKTTNRRELVVINTFWK